MANMYGKKMSKDKILQRVGGRSQIAGARYSRLKMGIHKMPAIVSKQI